MIEEIKRIIAQESERREAENEAHKNAQDAIERNIAFDICEAREAHISALQNLIDMSEDEQLSERAFALLIESLRKSIAQLQ